MNDMDNSEIINLTKSWVEHFVVGLNICPFAKLPFIKNRIRYETIKKSGVEDKLMAFWNEVVFLENAPASEISNSLLIFPEGFDDFLEYMDFYSLAENLLAAQNRNEQFQLASFHPNYRFEGTEENEVSNYTNRSPFPMIHVLRIEEVADAIASHPDIDSVPKRNIELMEKMGLDELRNILSK